MLDDIYIRLQSSRPIFALPCDTAFRLDGWIQWPEDHILVLEPFDLLWHESTSVTGRLLAVTGAVTLDTNNAGGITAPVAQLVVSRKNHNGVPFDIMVPLDGTTGIECRHGSGATFDGHQVIVTFANPVTVARVNVASSDGLATATQSASNGKVTIDLSSVANAQTIAITLLAISDGTNSGDVLVPMALLLGDTTGNGAVNASEVAQTKSQSGQTATSANFRTDVTVNGVINASDVALVKSKSGSRLP